MSDSRPNDLAAWSSAIRETLLRGASDVAPGGDWPAFVLRWPPTALGHDTVVDVSFAFADDEARQGLFMLLPAMLATAEYAAITASTWVVEVGTPEQLREAEHTPPAAHPDRKEMVMALCAQRGRAMMLHLAPVRRVAVGPPTLGAWQEMPATLGGLAEHLGRAMYVPQADAGGFPTDKENSDASQL